MNREKKEKKQNRYKWVIFITFFTFILSMTLSTITGRITHYLSIYFAILVLVIIVFIGIIFDVIGVAVTAADETPFHALASKKVKGARRAIKLLRNAEKVSSICNDVIGDISNIISGSTSAVIVLNIVAILKMSDDLLPSIILTALVAAVTVGGKAFGKTIAIKKANEIIFLAAKFLDFFSFKKIRK